MEHYKDFELKKYTSFKIGGKADNVYFPETPEEFIHLLKKLEKPLILGGMSNMLISSQGIRGDVILTKKLSSFEINGTHITAQTGAVGPLIAKSALENSLTGMEFMCGFPGTIGGIVCMNASAHGQSIEEIFQSARLFDLKEKSIKEFDKEDMKFNYRSSIIQTGCYILLDAVFMLKRGNADDIRAKMHSNQEFRRTKQPNLSKPNCGSVFKNPPGSSAGKLLDEAGAKELAQGNAHVFKDHANFIINSGNATSTEVSQLMKKMYNMVKEKYDVELIPEVRFAGEMNEVEKEIWNEFLRKKSI